MAHRHAWGSTPYDNYNTTNHIIPITYIRIDDNKYILLIASQRNITLLSNAFLFKRINTRSRFYECIPTEIQMAYPRFPISIY